METTAGRRRAIKAMVGMGVAALAGCGHAARSLAASDLPSPDAAPGPLGAPGPWAATASGPTLNIDAHCHIFNARDIPAEGFLRGPVRHDASQFGFDPKLIDRFASIIAKLVLAITPTASAELMWLGGRQLLRAEDLVGLHEQQQKSFIEHFTQAAQSTPMFKTLFARQLGLWLEQRASFLGPDKSLPPTDPTSPTQVQSILDQANQPSESEDDREIVELWSALGNNHRKAVGNPWNFVRFMFKATSYRILNLWTLQRTYQHSLASSIDVFCPSMLDFDYWLGNGSHNLADQKVGIRLMERIAVVTGGAILPLVAFNPEADVKENGAAFKRVCEAVEQRGFVGVKLYPPNGFLVSGNTAPSRVLEQCPDIRDAKAVNDALDRLYSWARDANVPIMAHTSHSIGSSAAKEECAVPWGWHTALQAIPKLFVQAGHFGGDDPVAIGEHWPGKIKHMMDTHPNLYADLSCMSSLFGAKPNVVALFRSLLVSCLSSGEIVADRLLYGSDFYMTDVDDSTRTFAKQMYQFIAALPGAACAPPNLTARVFGLNAVRFYGLAQGSGAGGSETNRSRIERFYNKHNVAKPAWMCKVDSMMC
jgi:predicted TIM-barrel fold metal-dependent hydrolase